MSENVRTVRIENEIRVNAPIERVFAAATTEQEKWYPHSYGGERLKAIVFEKRVGGLVYEDWGEGAGHLYGQVISYDPPYAYGTRGFLRGGIVLEQWAQFVEEGSDIILKASTLCFGEITDEMAKAIRQHGDLSNFEESFRTYVEQAM